MCCLLTLMAIAGPRVAMIIWWMVDMSWFQRVFDTAFWPILGIIFAPWTLLFYTISMIGGQNGRDWDYVLIVIGDTVRHRHHTAAASGAIARRFRGTRPEKSEPLVDRTYSRRPAARPASSAFEAETCELDDLIPRTRDAPDRDGRRPLLDGPGPSLARASAEASRPHAGPCRHQGSRCRPDLSSPSRSREPALPAFAPS